MLTEITTVAGRQNIYSRQDFKDAQERLMAFHHGGGCQPQPPSERPFGENILRI